MNSLRNPNDLRFICDALPKVGRGAFGGLTTFEITAVLPLEGEARPRRYTGAKSLFSVRSKQN